jgi:hypothetical protein
MGAAAIPLMIAGGGLTALQNWQSGQNASRAATSAANQMENNAEMAEYAAGQAKASAQRKSAEELRQNRRLQSRQIALAAASGASTSEKNIADLISDTAAEGNYASSVALYEGDLRSDALLTDAMTLRNKAVATRYEGRQARRAGNIGAISSILSTGAKAGNTAAEAKFYGRYGQRAPADLENDSYFNSPNYGRRGTYDSYFNPPPRTQSPNGIY